MCEFHVLSLDVGFFECFIKAFYPPFFIILSHTNKLGPFRAKSMHHSHLIMMSAGDACINYSFVYNFKYCSLLLLVLACEYIVCISSVKPTDKTFSQKWCKYEVKLLKRNSFLSKSLELPRLCLEPVFSTSYFIGWV